MLLRPAVTYTVNIAFQPRPASPSSLRNLCALRASALSFSGSLLRHSQLLRAPTAARATPFLPTAYFMVLWMPGGKVELPRMTARPLPLSPHPPLTIMAITPLSATLTKKQGGSPQFAQVSKLILLRTTAPQPQVVIPKVLNPRPLQSDSPLASVTPLSATLTKKRGESGTDLSLCKLPPHLNCGRGAHRTHCGTFDSK
jgi:hypothetical protein